MGFITIGINYLIKVLEILIIITTIPITIILYSIVMPIIVMNVEHHHLCHGHHNGPHIQKTFFRSTKLFYTFLKFKQSHINLTYNTCPHLTPVFIITSVQTSTSFPIFNLSQSTQPKVNSSLHY